MQTQKFKFHLHGVEIFGKKFIGENVGGVIVLVHGMGEHSGRYIESVIPTLLKSGFTVFTYDNVGHGLSSGKRGHCPSYEALLDILEYVLNLAESHQPDLPSFLYGHSMGGNLVLNYALRRSNRLSGIIATSPYLRLGFQPPKWKFFIGRLLLGTGITLPSGLDPTGISRIPEEVSKYNSDALIHDKVSPMFSFPVMDAGEWAIINAKNLKTLTLLLHGTGDPIIDYKGTEEFNQNATTTQLKLFEGGFHELHHDLCKDEMLNAVSNWLVALT